MGRRVASVPGAEHGARSRAASGVAHAWAPGAPSGMTLPEALLASDGELEEPVEQEVVAELLAETALREDRARHHQRARLEQVIERDRGPPADHLDRIEQSRHPPQHRVVQAYLTAISFEAIQLASLVLPRRARSSVLVSQWRAAAAINCDIARIAFAPLALACQACGGD